MQTHLSKKLGAAVTALTMLASNAAKAISGHTSDGFYWYGSDGGSTTNLYIGGYDGPSGVVAIPSSINGFPVTGLNGAFHDHTDISGVVIPRTIVYITNDSFRNCTALQEITIPDTVTDLEGGEFYGCTSLVNVSLPHNAALNNIKPSMFQGCSSLKNITIPNSVQWISAEAFEGCSSLTSVTIPSSVAVFATQVDTDYSHAFANCTSLTQVCFQGDAPFEGGYSNDNIFHGDPVSVIYCNYGTLGWRSTFDGIATSSCFECAVPIVMAPSATGPDKPIDLNSSGAPNLALVIHGFTPGTKTPYSDAAEMPKLAAALQARIQADGKGSQWDVRFFDWTATGGGSHGLLGVYPQQAVRNGIIIGERTGQQIVASGKYKQVLLVSWSAGPWLASQINSVTAANGIETSSALLDAFIPARFPIVSDDNIYSDNQLGVGLSDSQQYFETNSIFHSTGVGFPLPNAENYNITPLETCFGYNRDAHAWPPTWYTYTIQDSSYPYGYQDAFISGGGGGVTTLDCSGGAAPLIQAQPQVQSLGGAEPMDTTNSPIPQYSPFTIMGSAMSLTNLNVAAQGGSGTVSTNANGLQLSTSSFLWESLSLSTTNDINIGTVDYSNSATNDSVLTLWIDGQLVQAIESDTNSPLTTDEFFPLPTALDGGRHVVTVGLESVNLVPVSTTIKNVGLYYMVSQPLLTSQSVDTNGNFNFTWEAAPGLKYQPQYNSDLTSSQWLNIGGLLTSPTNAIISAFDYIYTNQQRFYRVQLVQ